MKNVSGSGWPGYFRLRFCRQFGLNINVAIKNKEMLRDQAELVSVWRWQSCMTSQLLP